MAVFVNPYRFAPPPGGPGHRYWRILINEGSSGNALELGEIEMRASVGGPDQCTGGSAFASSANGANTADKAFDDSNSSAWIAASGAVPQHIGYDFGTPVQVAELYMYPSTGTRAPTDFDFQWSDDGSAWTTVYRSLDMGGQDWSAAARRFLVNCAVSYKFVFTANNGGSNTRIAEMEFRATAGGADQTTPGFPGPSAIGSNTTNTDTADRIFANDGATTAWEPAVSSGVIRYDFPTNFSLAEYTILTVTPNSNSPRDWTVEKSVDGGVSWSVVHTLTAQTFVAGTTRTFTI